MARFAAPVMNTSRVFSGGARMNTEITEIAQGVYDARDRAMAWGAAVTGQLRHFDLLHWRPRPGADAPGAGAIPR